MNSMEHTEGFLQLTEAAKQRIHEVSAEEAYGKVTSGDNVHLIDVREDREWSAGHARGAEHLSKGIIERDIERRVPDKTTEVILYCGGGYRSALAADTLQQMGYGNVHSMTGGWRDWQARGLPTEGD